MRAVPILLALAALALGGGVAPAAFAQSKTLLRISTPAVPDDWHGKIADAGVELIVAPALQRVKEPVK